MRLPFDKRLSYSVKSTPRVDVRDSYKIDETKKNSMNK